MFNLINQFAPRVTNMADMQWVNDWMVFVSIADQFE